MGYNPHSTSLSILDGEHYDTLSRAISNVLSTDLAKFTYAQILDGLPTLESFQDSYMPMDDHPVFTLRHTELCEGALDKARTYRSKFQISDLIYELETIEAFQITTPGTKQYYLRLIELVVIACHQIGAYLYELDDGFHKHELHQHWIEQRRLKLSNGAGRKQPSLPPSAFFHVDYAGYEQYPKGVADVVGYWAEGKIFGGVVVFDRGECEKECKSMWIHGAYIGGPRTLYPPTERQFNDIVRFLLSNSGNNGPCPLHIRATNQNIPRWDPVECFASHHIFRDRYERKVLQGETSWLKGHRQSYVDWPEMNDYFLLSQLSIDEAQGRPVNKAEREAALQ